MGEPIAMILIPIIAVIIIVGYLVVRVRQPKPPPPANSNEQEGGRGADTGLEPEGALADEDPIPRDADGMPMVQPPDDPADVDADRLQRQARGPHDEPQRP